MPLTGSVNTLTIYDGTFTDVHGNYNLNLNEVQESGEWDKSVFQKLVTKHFLDRSSCIESGDHL